MTFEMLNLGNESKENNLTFGDIFNNLQIIDCQGNKVSGFEDFDILPIKNFHIRELYYDTDYKRFFLLEHKISKAHTIIIVDNEDFYGDLLK